MDTTIRFTYIGPAGSAPAQMDILDHPTLKSPNGPTREQVGAPADNE
jgi:hypothetical protein